MKFCLRIISLLVLVTGTLTEELDLLDAFDDDGAVDPTPAKPKEQPKAPEKPKTDGDFELDLEDAISPDLKPDPKPDPKPADKPKEGGGGFGFDLGDAVGPDPNPTPKPDKPAVNPSGGGGGSFDDGDLFDLTGGGGGYKPDEGRAGGGGAVDPGYDSHGGADQPQEASSGPIAGIVSAIGVALLGAASSYFAYQKKKLCFKIQGGADPEMGKGQHGQSDPQVFSNLLRTS